jgi:mannose-6-phosphate isomerase-like protein (cupin superfamily)
VDKPFVLGPGEGERISERLRIKVGRPEFVVTESDYEPGGRGPDPHVHRHHVDAFWVLQGRLAFALGPDGGEVEAGADGFALVPPGVVHTFRNPGPEDARFLNFHAPGMGFDTYLRSGYEIPYDQHDPPADGGRPASEVIAVPPEVVDSFYVLEGVLSLHLDGESVEAPAGAYAVVPPGNDRTFSNPRDEPVRMLNVMAPGGLEHHFLAG